MELKFSPLSPYVRKVMVVAHEAGVIERIRVTRVDTGKEPEKIAPLNPLGKIPVLITDAGASLYDSPVICEYLDAEYGGRRLLPAAGPRRWELMTRAALADGLLDAGVLMRHERARAPELQSPAWMDRQMRKLRAGLDFLEGDVDRFGDALDMGQVAVGCALGYLPLRVADLDGLAGWPRLTAWYATLVRRPSFAQTIPVV